MDYLYGIDILTLYKSHVFDKPKQLLYPNALYIYINLWN